MTTIGIIIFIFALFALSRVVLRSKDNSISFREGLFWIIIWITVVILTTFPQLTDNFSEIVGIGRGVDTAFFVAIILLLYIVFRLYVKIESLDRTITKLNTGITKMLHSKKRSKK